MPLNRPDIGWAVSTRSVPHASAVAAMEARAAAIVDGSACELIWLVEHEALYTAGSSARSADLVAPDRFPVHITGRGGRHTYHGPGQRIVYVMLDLRRRGRDVRAFITSLEEWIIATLAEFGIDASADRDQVGLWVARAGNRADKIGAIGLRIRKWVSLHGVSINLDPDLEHYSGIVPCGIDAPDRGVTSMAALGVGIGMSALDRALEKHFVSRFGAVHPVNAPWP